MHLIDRPSMRHPAPRPSRLSSSLTVAEKAFPLRSGRTKRNPMNGLTNNLWQSISIFLGPCHTPTRPILDRRGTKMSDTKDVTRRYEHRRTDERRKKGRSRCRVPRRVRSDHPVDHGRHRIEDLLGPSSWIDVRRATEEIEVDREGPRSHGEMTSMSY